MLKKKIESLQIYALLIGLLAGLTTFITIAGQSLTSDTRSYPNQLSNVQQQVLSDNIASQLPLVMPAGLFPDLGHVITPTSVLPGSNVDVQIRWAAGELPLDSVVFTYTLPLTLTTYVPGSVQIEYSNTLSQTEDTDPSIEGDKLTWDGNYALAPNDTMTISFQIMISDNYNLFPPLTIVENKAQVSGKLEGLLLYPDFDDIELAIKGKPSLIISKKIQPQSNNQIFYFSFTDIDQSEEFELISGESKIFNILDPGIYTVTELIQDNGLTLLTDISCTGDESYTTDLEQAGVYFNLDFGEMVSCIFFNEKPTSVLLDSITTVGGHEQIIVQWRTLIELDTAGFNILRSTTSDGVFQKLNNNLIEATGNSITGSDYEFLDGEVENGVTYYYFLQEVTLTGNLIDYMDQIVWVTLEDSESDPALYKIYLPLLKKVS